MWGGYILFQLSTPDNSKSQVEVLSRNESGKKAGGEN